MIHVQIQIHAQILTMMLTMTLALMLMLAMTMTMTVGRAEIAASSVGSGYYEACLAFHTTTNKVCLLDHNYNDHNIESLTDPLTH